MLVQLEAELLARTYGYKLMPHSILVKIMSFASASPDRPNASLACKTWSEAARDSSLCKRVLPAEAVAAAKKHREKVRKDEATKQQKKALRKAIVEQKGKHHSSAKRKAEEDAAEEAAGAAGAEGAEAAERAGVAHEGAEATATATVSAAEAADAAANAAAEAVAAEMDDDERERLEGEAMGVYHSIQRALAAATPGETILLGPGHYWEQDLVASRGVQLVGDASDAARVVVELTGTVDWHAPYGIMANLTIRRPRRCKQPTPAIVVGGGPGARVSSSAADSIDAADAASVDGVVAASGGASGGGLGVLDDFGRRSAMGGGNGLGGALHMHGCVVNNEGGGGGSTIVVADDGRLAMQSCQVAHSDNELGGVVRSGATSSPHHLTTSLPHYLTTSPLDHFTT